MEICLRVFNYSVQIALESKVVSELEHLALLLPFYLLKVRAELKRCESDSEKRKELAERLAGYVSEIAETLHRSRENSYITDSDVVMLKERMRNMHSELYGSYKEFSMVDMTIEQMYNESVLKKIDEAEVRLEARAEARADARIAEAEKRYLSQGITQVAKAMKDAGDTVSKIMHCTGLSRRKIMAL